MCCFLQNQFRDKKGKKQKQRQKRMGTWRVRECTHSLGIVALSWNFCECESTQAPFHGYLGETIFVYSFEARHLHPLCKYVDKSQPLNLLFTKKRTSRHLKPVDFKDSRAFNSHRRSVKLCFMLLETGPHPDMPGADATRVPLSSRSSVWPQ